MADTPLETAAQAFDAVMKADVGKAPPRRNSPRAENDGPTDVLFRNSGRVERDEDSPDQGGGDGDTSIEEMIYGRDQDSRPDARSRDSRKTKEEDREGDDDESSGDGSDGDEYADADGADGDAADDDGEHDEGDGEATPASKEEANFFRQKVEVTVDGEPVEVSVKEALEGYVRTETFHRRMNQLDEAKKIVRRAAGDAIHNFEYSIAIAKEMEAHMEQMIPKEPNWDEEFAKDPAKARELQRYHEKANAFRTDLRNRTAELRKKQQEADAKQLAAFAEEESSKFESMNRKQWADPKKKVKDLHSMRRTALSAGFTEEELSSVYDSRMLNVLLKASKYDRMMASKPKPAIRRQGKPIPPGAGSAKSRTAQRGVTSAMNRLNRTGSIEDAAVVFDQIIARG